MDYRLHRPIHREVQQKNNEVAGHMESNSLASWAGALQGVA